MGALCYSISIVRPCLWYLLLLAQLAMAIRVATTTAKNAILRKKVGGLCQHSIVGWNRTSWCGVNNATRALGGRVGMYRSLGTDKQV